MMRKYFSIVIVILFHSITAFAQLSGPLSGVITAGNYTVEGNISVSDSLIIEPGTIFNFNGHYSFYINAYIYAVGTETDSIKFIPNTGVAAWGGIAFGFSTDDSSRLGYCLITGSDDIGISFEYASPTIANCTISENTGEGLGGGIYCQISSPTIINCIIGDNMANGNFILSFGGGICCEYSSPTIANCTISGNIALVKGGGIYCDLSNPTIIDCIISGNAGAGGGGGIYCDNSSPFIANCTISDNMTTPPLSYGGGIYSNYNSHPTGVNNIIWANSSGQIYLGGGGSFTCTYSDIQGSWEGTGNIDADPLFHATTGDSAYYLTSGSPCIDAGDPTSPLDPDSTIADMGAYYYDQGLGVNDITDIGISTFHLYPPYPNPFNPTTTLSFEIQEQGDISLIVYDISGRQVAVLVDDFVSSGKHEAVFDGANLSSGIYFARLQSKGFTAVQKLLLLK